MLVLVSTRSYPSPQLRLFVTDNVIAGQATDAALVDLLRKNKTLVLLSLSGTGIVLTAEIDEALKQCYSIRSLGGKVTSAVAAEVTRFSSFQTRKGCT